MATAVDLVGQNRKGRERERRDKKMYKFPGEMAARKETRTRAGD